MTSTPQARNDAHEAYLRAALAIAVSVSTQDQIDNAPSIPADRSARADRLRADHMKGMLAAFREAEQRFNEAMAS